MGIEAMNKRSVDGCGFRGAHALSRAGVGAHADAGFLLRVYTPLYTDFPAIAIRRKKFVPRPEKLGSADCALGLWRLCFFLLFLRIGRRAAV